MALVKKYPTRIYWWFINLSVGNKVFLVFDILFLCGGGWWTNLGFHVSMLAGMMSLLMTAYAAVLLFFMLWD